MISLKWPLMYLRAGRINRSLCAVLCTVLCTQNVSAQAVQAARGSMGSRVETARAVQAYVADVRRAAAQAADAATSATEADLRAALQRVAATAAGVQGESNAERNAALFAEFKRAVDAACTVLIGNVRFDVFKAAAHCSMPRAEAGRIAESSAQVPAIFVAVPDVVFTVGYEGTFARGSQLASGGVSIGTNLLGAAVGTGFDAIGSESLKNYFTDNLSAGFTIPSGGRNRLSGALGVGLGRTGFRGITFWPTLSMEQLDTADTRVPANLLTDAPTESRWSQPALTVAIVYPKLLERISNGRVGLIATVGVRLPHYYAGDTFNAIGALFSSKRSDFKRSGRAQFTVGIAFPLLKVLPATTGTTTTDGKSTTDSSPPPT